MNTMSIAVDNAIKVLAEKITDSVPPDSALKFTQAALNLAHVKAILKNS